jgi:hypothetical protein
VHGETPLLRCVLTTATQDQCAAEV